MHFDQWHASTRGHSTPTRPLSTIGLICMALQALIRQLRDLLNEISVAEACDHLDVLFCTKEGEREDGVFCVMR